MSLPTIWSTERAKWRLEKQMRPSRPNDGIVTAFRDGQVTLRANRRTEGFTEAVQEIGYQGIRKGDLVVHSMDGFAGAIGVSDSDGKASPVVHAYRIASGDPRFVSYVLRTMAVSGYIESLAKGIRERSTAFDAATLANLQLPWPPLEEQRRVADFLDAETAQIGRLDELAVGTMGLLRERRQAFVEQIMVRSSATTQKLFRCLQLLRDGTHQPPARTGTGIPLLTARNVSSGTLRLTELDTFVSPEDAEALEGTVKPRHRDVLLSVKGTIGAVAIVPPGFPRAVLDRNLALLRPTKTLLNEWLVWALRTRKVQEQMQLSIAAAAQPGLPLGIIRELKIPAADLQTQKQQVAQIEQIDQQITDLESRIRSQRNLLAERRQALITAAVTGGITV